MGALVAMLSACATPTTNAIPQADPPTARSGIEHPHRRFDFVAFSKEHDRVRAEASHCRQPGLPEGRSQVHFVFESNRPEPTVSFVYGKYKGAAAGDCVLALARTIRVPSFEGGPQVIDADFVLGDDDGPPGGIFDRASAAMALGEAGEAAISCYNGPQIAVHLRITFAGDGSTLGVVVDNPSTMVGTPVARCVEERFRSVRVRPFAGPPVTIGKMTAVGTKD